MARQARIISESGIYHVILRGVNRIRVFLEEEDFVYFLDRLKSQTELQMTATPDVVGEASLSAHCEIYAYCLMSNHIHLLIKEKDEPIGMVMKRITSSYVYYFNHKYDRVGHLFQERFKSQPVEDEDYFITLLRYIHQNPVKANMVDGVDQYRWSSWNELMCDEAATFCNRQRVLDMITLHELEDLVARPLMESEEDGILDYDADDEHAELSLDELQSLMEEIAGCHQAEDFKRLPKAVQCECVGRMIDEGGLYKDLSLLTGIPKTTVFRMAAKWKEKNRAINQIVADDFAVEDYPDY